MNIQEFDSYQQAQLSLIDHDRESKDTLYHLFLHQSETDQSPFTFFVLTIQQLEEHLKKNEHEKHQWHECIGIGNEPTMLFAKIHHDLGMDIDRFINQLRQGLIEVFESNKVEDPFGLGMSIQILIEDNCFLRVPDVVVEDMRAQKRFWKSLIWLENLIDLSLYDGNDSHLKFPISSRIKDLERSMVMRPCRRFGFWIPNC